MKVFYCVFFYFYTAPLIASDNEWESFLDNYSKQFNQKLERASIPGAALSIVRVGHSSLIKGFGKTNVKNNQNVDQHTRFRLASLSKTFTGSLAAKLSTEGRINLDAYVHEYLPLLKKTHFKTLKVRHILSHSGGLVPNAYDNLIESNMGYSKIKSKLMALKPICQPGKCYGYQNVFFSLISDVIFHATGLTYNRWMSEFLFAPLNMRDGGVGLKNLHKDGNYAAPHVKGKKYWHSVKLKTNYYKVLPAAGINASAQDMHNWLQAQLGLFPSVLSPRAISLQKHRYTPTKRELRRRVWRKFISQADYGLGWRIYKYQGVEVIYHSGWVQGYRTDIAVIPSLDIGISILLNAESGIINELTTGFLNQVMDVVKD